MLSTVPSETRNTNALHSNRAFPRDALPNIFVGVGASMHRTMLQQLIAQGFSRAYNASLHSFMPVLLGAGGNKPYAALGVRSASSPLFVETYMPAPVESMLAHTNIVVKRSEIAEIGNLYSRHASYTQPLLLATALGLLQVNYSVMVFTATAQLRALMNNIGLPLTYLCEASKHSLGSATAEWGSYYDTQPQVVALRISEIPRLITQSDTVSKMFDCMESRLPEIATTLRAYL
ncbi:thermostable hemolysin [Alteromonas sp. A079]|uniref:thermostable hemolysin n=1 Tax=Alteromonas sp. A079 TaxID=3410268 RepID=UPI003BA39E7E